MTFNKCCRYLDIFLKRELVVRLNIKGICLNCRNKGFHLIMI